MSLDDRWDQSDGASERIRAEAVRRVLAGEPVEAVARALGLEDSTVLQWQADALSAERDARTRRAARRRVHRRRIVLAGACALILLAGLVLARQNHHAAGEPGQSSAAATAATLARDAQAVTTDPAVAAQLAIAAYRSAPIPAAADQLYRAAEAPLDSVVARTGSEVIRVATQPDGPLAAAVDTDGALRIWSLADPAAPALQATLQVKVTAMAFVPHRALLAGPCSTLDELCLWSLADPRHPVAVDHFAVPKSGVTSVAASANGTLLAAALMNGETLLWSLARPGPPQLLATLANPSPKRHDDLAAVALAPSGKLLATTVQDGETELWSLADPARPARLAIITTGYQALAFSPDGGRLAAAGDLLVGLWNLAAPAHPAAVGIGSACAQSNPGDATDFSSIAFSPDGGALAYSGENDTQGTSDTSSVLCLLDLSPANLESGSPTAESIQTPFGSLAVAYASDGALLYGGMDGTVSLWRSPEPQISGTGITDDDTWDTSGNLLAAPIGTGAAQKPPAFGLWDLATPDGPTLDATVPLSTRMLAFLSSSALLTVAADGAVRIWNVADPAHPAQAASLGTADVAPLRTWSPSVEVSSDSAGNLVAVLGGDGRLHLWRIKGPSAAVEVGSMPAATGPPVVLLADGHTAAMITSTGVTWWDTADPGKPVRVGSSPLPGANKGGGAAAGDLFAATGAPSANGDRALHLFAVADGRPRSAVTLTDSVGGELDVSGNGRLLAAAGSDNSAVDLWDIADPARPRRLADFAVPDIYGLAFSPTADLVADWNDSTVQLWDVSNPTAPALRVDIPLPPQVLASGQSVGFVAFTRSGSELLVDAGSSVLLLDTDPSALADRLCSFVGSPLSSGQWRQYAPGVTPRQACPQ